MKNLFSKIQSRKILILIVFLLIGLIFYFTYKHFSFKKIVSFKETQQEILNQPKKIKKKLIKSNKKGRGKV
jgi:predicted negative regulator of RcsB-dependent stress response